MMELADVHCHLNFDSFNRDRDEVVRRAKVAGVVFLIDSGFDYTSNERSLRVSGSYEGFVFSTLGFSPNRIGKSDPRYVANQIEENRDRIIGVGEVGLDLKKAKASYEQQKEIFLQFVELAEELELPLIIHARKAEERAFDLIKSRDVTAVFHCYTGSTSLVGRITDAEHYISLSTLVCFSDNVKRIAEVVDVDHLLLETDSPFLSPVKGRNEPANVKMAYETVASLQGVGVDELAIKLIKNAREVFDVDI
ncbi:MAG: YchF/TatD family DNA exonuclease [Archaeoglobi archaeon]|nr:YchF/TatD family DNA exonuclease [Archaeoglobi archaeon]